LKKLDKFIKSNSFSLKNEKDLIVILDYYNSI